MVRPESFASNPQTLGSNHFQTPATAGRTDLAEAARREVDRTAAALEAAGVAVHVVPGNAANDAPDEVFPNNWVSFHADGTVVLYPMLAPNRRRERREAIVAALRDAMGYRINRIVDLTHHERHGRYLEGTGSMVLDRLNRVAYACLSPRTHSEALTEFGRSLGYEVITVEAHDRDGNSIYHTNVLMSLGTTMAVICPQAIRDAPTRRSLLGRLRESGREVIALGFDQLHAFAANLLELQGRRGAVIALSARALASLDDDRRARLAAHGELAAADVSTIETFGGGSIRCMLAEVHLARQGDADSGDPEP
jgi:hypothetical protein